MSEWVRREQKEIKITLVLLTLFIVSGCSGNQAEHTLSNAIDNALVATSGNKPPDRFAFASPYRANGYVMQNKDYSFTMPLTKDADWTKMTGWRGASDFQGIGIFLRDPEAQIHITLEYHIGISSYTGKYGETERAVEEKDQSYIDNIRIRYQYPKNIKLYYGTIGKEKYSCTIKEREGQRGERIKNYNCIKSNQSHTKYKAVNIKLIYTNSPNLPAKYKHLAKQYTYQDLQNRAKRTLDSLYIKDGW